MDDHAFPSWTLRPQGQVSLPTVDPPVSVRTSPVRVPPPVETTLRSLAEWLHEWAMKIARGVLVGVEFFRQFLGPAELLSMTSAKEALPTVVAPLTWGVTARYRSPIVCAAPSVPASDSLPPDPAQVASHAPSQAEPTLPVETRALFDANGIQSATEEASAPNLNLARAWLRATNPLQDTDSSVEGVAWDEIPTDEVRSILIAAVFARARSCQGSNSGCERDGLGVWLGEVADVAFDDPVERLHWMSEIAPALVRHGIDDDRREELIGAAAEWLTQVPWRDPQAVFGALRVVERIANSGIDPAGTLMELAGEVWRDRSGPKMRAEDAEKLSKVGVTRMTVALARRDGPRARMYAHLILTLAVVSYVDVADRLRWFATGVARPVGTTGVDGSPVRDVLTEGVRRWFEALPKESTCAVIEVVIAWWGSPMGACTHEASIAQWISEARPNPDVDSNERDAHKRAQVGVVGSVGGDGDARHFASRDHTDATRASSGRRGPRCARSNVPALGSALAVGSGGAHSVTHLTAATCPSVRSPAAPRS